MKTNSYERMSTRTRFEKEAKGNSEMAYYPITTILNSTLILSWAVERILADFKAHMLFENAAWLLRPGENNRLLWLLS